MSDSDRFKDDKTILPATARKFYGPRDHRDWIECWSCLGEGEHQDCFEDTCVCLYPPCRRTRCVLCQGKGGWYADEDDE